MSDQYKYFLRCKVSEKEKLKALAIKLGVLVEIEFAPGVKSVVPVKPTTTWADFGLVNEPTGKTIKNTELGIEIPEEAPVCDLKSGEPYWHVNLYMDDDLKAMAMATLAKTNDPELAAALKDMSRFFLTDPATGKPVAPKNPALTLM